VNVTAACDVGVIGMAVMGRNLALNLAQRGFSVAVHSRNFDSAQRAQRDGGGGVIACRQSDGLLEALRRPRKVLLVVKAGPPIDEVMARLAPRLERGDVVVDCGNAWFDDTRRRESQSRATGIHFVGLGVSGGAAGALHGPSLMAGGSLTGYEIVRPLLEAIAARAETGVCLAFVGDGGAGHFVKMVHNGIEYADMQAIAEAYDVLRGIGGYSSAGAAGVFDEWNRGQLESLLVGLTAQVLAVRDDLGEGQLVDAIEDSAEQKGTGVMAVRAALGLGVPVPSMAFAVDARVLSSRRDERAAARRAIGSTRAEPGRAPDPDLTRTVHDALLAARLLALAQGFDLMRSAKREYGWAIDLREIARIWRAGCIVRSASLGSVMSAYERAPGLLHLLLDPAFVSSIALTHRALREVVTSAQRAGIPVATMAASLGYLDTMTAMQLPQNLVQALRDAFGEHGHRRMGDPVGVRRHHDWTS